MLLSLALAFGCLLQSASQGQWARGLHFPGLHFNVSERAVVALEYDDHSGEGPALFVGGRFDGIGTELTSNLARWHGDRWSSLPATPDGDVRCMRIFDDGNGEELFVGGEFTNVGSLPVSSVAAWNGTSWRAVGNSLRDVSEFIVHDDGGGAMLYALERNPPYGFGSFVARWNGQDWEPVGSYYGLDVRAAWSVPAGSGRELITEFTVMTPYPSSTFARWNGTDWEPFDFPSTYRSFGLWNLSTTDFLAVDVTNQDLLTYSNGAWHSLGTIGVGNKHFARISDGSGTALYALNEAWPPIATITAWKHDGVQWRQLFQHTNLTPLDYDDVFLTARRRSSLEDVEFVAGGRRCRAWGVQLTGIATLASDGTRALGLGQGWTGTTSSATVFDFGTGPNLYMPGSGVQADGHAPDWMTRHDGRGWSNLPVPYGLTDHWVCSVVHRDALGSALWVGSMTPGHSLQRFDGTSWSEPLGPVSSAVRALGSFELGTGPELYFALDWQFGGSTSVLNRWNGSSWTPLGPADGGFASCLVSYDDGAGPAVFAAGRLRLEPTRVESVARWNGTSWSALGTETTFGAVVEGMQVFDDGSGPALFVGGEFDSIGGVPAQGIARWNGTSWSGLGGACNGAVTSLTVFDDGTGPALYATGSFTQIGGVAASHLARWNGTSWSEFGGGLHSMPGHESRGTRLAVFDDHFGGGPTLCVFGTFQRAGDTVSCNFARWGRVVGAPSPFCDGSGDTTITPCPCNNHGARGRGCANSANALGAALGTTGSNLDDSLVLVASGLPGATTCVFLQGTEQGDAPFGDGVLCLGGAIVRVALRSASAGVCTLPNASDTLTLAQMGGVQLGSGAIRRYQTYYRNGAASFCPPASFNATNGVEVGW
ncbi:MAG: hypothetical protein IPJ77_09875 [Planctomycetes bacterium]|nr:hypothetical protein [Planctomycetota bacterium]